MNEPRTKNRRRTTQSVEVLLASFDALARASDGLQFARAVASAASATLASDSVAVTLIGPAERLVYSNPLGFFGPSEQALFEEIHQVSPWTLAAHTRVTKNRPLRSSDTLSRCQYRSLPIYLDLFRSMEIEFQTAFSFLHGANLTCVVINRRTRDFSDNEIETLAALQVTLASLTNSVTRHSEVATNTPDTEIDDSSRTLTLREQAVLGLMMTGLTDVAIGHHLNISARTVSKHLQHVYAKLQVSNRTEAAATWHAELSQPLAERK